MLLDLPNISASSDPNQTIEEIRRYIYKSNEQINLALEQTTPEKIWQYTAEAISTGNSKSPEETEQEKNKYTNLRDLIVKTADKVLISSDEIKKTLQGTYIAKSNFGRYLLNTKVDILQSSRSIEELFTYAAEADQYTVFSKTLFRRGLLDDSVVPPIYGMEIGLLEYQVVNNELIEVNSDKYIRITPDKIGLWQSGTEVAYISAQALYFPNANITGGSINLSNNFIVASDGTVTMKKGSINIGDKFIAYPNGDLSLKGIVDATKFDIRDPDGFLLGEMGLYQSNYLGYNGKRNYGINLGAPFIEFGNFLWTGYDGEYKAGLLKGFYARDDVNNVYKGRTTSINVNGDTLYFRDGLLVGNAIPLV